MLARQDLASAEAMLGLLDERGGIDGEDWGPVAEGLWTGAAVSYVRPFTKSDFGVSSEWEEFDDVDLAALHQQLRHLRDKLFAHTDNESGRTIILEQLGGRVWVREQRATFSVSAIPACRDLFIYQQARMGRRLDEIVETLKAAGAFVADDLAS